MVDAYLEGSCDQQLQSMAQKLASLDFGAFKHAHGLTEYNPGARYNFGTPPSADDLRDHGDRKAMLEAVPDFSPLPWLETLPRVSNLADLHPIDWAIMAIAYGNGIAHSMELALYEAIGGAFLDRLWAACALKIDPTRSRILTSPISIAGIETAPSATPPPEIPLKNAAPTITQVFEDCGTARHRDTHLLAPHFLAQGLEHATLVVDPANLFRAFGRFLDQYAAPLGPNDALDRHLRRRKKTAAARSRPRGSLPMRR